MSIYICLEYIYIIYNNIFIIYIYRKCINSKIIIDNNIRSFGIYTYTYNYIYMHISRKYNNTITIS